MMISPRSTSSPSAPGGSGRSWSTPIRTWAHSISLLAPPDLRSQYVVCTAATAGVRGTTYPSMSWAGSTSSDASPPRGTARGPGAVKDARRVVRHRLREGVVRGGAGEEVLEAQGRRGRGGGIVGCQDERLALRRALDARAGGLFQLFPGDQEPGA